MTIIRSLLPSHRRGDSNSRMRHAQTALARAWDCGAYPKRWHLWARTAFASERADRFIKHPGRDSLIATNQLNWIVWAQCFNDRRCRKDVPSECTYGSVLPHQDGHKRRSRREGMGDGGEQTHTYSRRLGTAIGGRATPYLRLLRGLSQWTRCDTRNATPLNHCAGPNLLPASIPSRHDFRARLARSKKRWIYKGPRTAWRFGDSSRLRFEDVSPSNCALCLSPWERPIDPRIMRDLG